MDWFTRMNKALDYIEGHLDDELDINHAAKIACSSPYHFQRMFHAIIGITPADYIRRRRLTLAAMELASGNSKIIEIAAKYGYESPNAFTRAFKNMHGVVPSKARTPGTQLAAYHRLSFKVEIKGGNELNYRIVEKPAFEIGGKSQQFNYDEFIKNGPKFWKEYVGSDEYTSLWDLNKGKCGQITESPLLSVYFPSETENRNAFIDVLGVEKHAKTNPQNFEVYPVPAATYAEFYCTYHTSMKTNKYIYGEWFSSTGYERDGNKPDVAAYFPVAFRPLKEMGIRWWVPVVKK